MSSELVETLIAQAEMLTPSEKQRLIESLAHPETDLAGEPENHGAEPSAASNGGMNAERYQRYMSWIRKHRREYAERYVALDDDRLVGCGSTIREAQTQAIENGIPSPFLVFIHGEDAHAFAGW